MAPARCDGVAAVKPLSGMELLVICKTIVADERVRKSAPLAVGLLEEAMQRYRRNNGLAEPVGVGNEVD